MSTVPADIDGPSDAELIESVRAGATTAYGSLYERHVSAAHNLARQLTRSQAEADDLVSEAFAKVLDTLRQGRGPDSAFRAYLLTALRHTAYDKTRRDRKVELSDDVSQVSGVNPDAVSVPFSDPAVAGLERSLAARAFAKLPERWQAVLWHTEIEGQSPAQVAPLLGLSPNGVSALAYRAREGLRQAYLQVHLVETTADRCRSTAERLGAWVRGGLSKRETAQVEVHLDECDRCRALAAELSDVNGGLRLIVAPLVLGPLAVGGYLAAAKAAAGSTAVVGGAVVGGAVATGSASGVAGAGASVPRQFVGAAASGVAMVAAIAVGLIATPTGQEIPDAAPPRPTEVVTSSTAGQPSMPAKQEQTPAGPSATEADSPMSANAESLPAPEQPQPPPSPAPTPLPGPASLSAEGPSVPLSLVPGKPTDLPITVRNTGGSVSEPVRSSITLPAGVSAIPSRPNRLAGDPLVRLDAPLAAARQQTGTVYCEGGTGTVACGTEEGLRPGASVTLLYRLIAEPSAAGGQIVGSVTAGSAINVRISVPVTIVAPPVNDGVDIRAWLTLDDPFGAIWPWQRGYRVVTLARNTGDSAKPVTVSFSDQVTLRSATAPVNCAQEAARFTCTTTSPLAPKAVVSVVVSGERASDHPHADQDHKITVTATLGGAVDTDTVTISWFPWVPWWPNAVQEEKPAVPAEPKPSPAAPPVTTTPPRIAPPPAPAKTTKAPPKPADVAPTTTKAPAVPTTTAAPAAKPGARPGDVPVCADKAWPKWSRWWWGLPC
ncbi:sigma-70 family RNA polymerase sigma factor [Actinokineospora iranica]|uniref:RNA polymerase sigma factor, sigma-70 family n=1 Tax=Actinokineospora iranica TaxID=1271860 RepID=A0A1G6SX11_9PSEU|nr:sigma-70 family RNA polymerase sigma factor [Actinokineospora iranica]SDD20727.1 RNA polymerase sigma factor, sigma-70 family [Actinokineospora iranica]